MTWLRRLWRRRKYSETTSEKEHHQATSRLKALEAELRLLKRR